MMTGVRTAVMEAISQICMVDPINMSDEKHIFDDLGVDSLDFLDVVFELDRTFGVKLPIEAWLNSGDLDGNGRQLLVVGKFVSFVEDAVRRKAGV